MFQVPDLFPSSKTKVQDALIAQQSKGKDHMRGSWTPSSGVDSYGGRVLATALCTMSLEIYFRHLLLYQEAAQFPAPHALVRRLRDEKDANRRLTYVKELGFMASDSGIREYLGRVARTDADKKVRERAAVSLRLLDSRTKGGTHETD